MTKLTFRSGDSPVKSKKMTNRKLRDILFCALILLYPTVQFLIFYIGVNGNSILLAFTDYDYKTGYVWNNFDNFRMLWYNIRNEALLTISLKNSLLLFAVNILVGTTLSLLFAYYIFKKRALSKLYKVLLFLPSIISPLVLTMIFRYFVGKVYPEIVHEITGEKVLGLLSMRDTLKSTLIFFTVFVSFGVNVLIYNGSMSGINESILEYAEIDGAGHFRKFWNIVIPLIFPTLITFLVVQIAGIFTNQMNLFSFYTDSADYSVYTIGYYLYRRTSLAAISEYPYLSAMGIMYSLVSIPITLIAKKALEKFGPKAY